MSGPKAKNSPLRDCMLDLHKNGIKVTFFEGRPEDPDDTSQMFFVEMPNGFTESQYSSILKRIAAALNASAEAEQAPAKLTRQAAKSYVDRLKTFNSESGRNK